MTKTLLKAGSIEVGDVVVIRTTMEEVVVVVDMTEEEVICLLFVLTSHQITSWINYLNKLSYS